MNILREIVPRAKAAGLSFLMIGGNAVIAYGFPRQTADLDLMVIDGQREVWDAMALSLGYRHHNVQTNFMMYNPISGAMPALDLVLVDASTFEKLAADAKQIEVAGERVEIPSLRHLIALKLHALRGGQAYRFERDMLDIITLIQLHGISLASADYAAILSRYGTPALRAEIERRLAGFDTSGA